MHWADQIAKDIIQTGKHEPLWVDDMKTPSGRVHVGALRGVMVHDLVYKSLQSLNKNVHYTYVFNDMDTMDSLPNYLDKQIYEPFMGVPLYKIPAPDVKFPNFATQYAQDFIEVFTSLGATPEIIWSHELYESGKMNQAIKVALDNASVIREIYRKVAKQEKPAKWHPFQVICPHCGKLGSTLVDDWDGEQVHFRCVPDMVVWAKGCGYEGSISPFNGTGKLMWKIDWPAHWRTIGVTIEGAGKDHSSEGGSRDIAKEIAREVFGYPEPFDIPYEWFLIGGRKMSSSKGVGTSAREFSELLPPTIGRFLFVKTKYNRHLDFDPNGMTIPDLFDDYDKMAQAYWSGEETDYSRTFVLSQVGEIPSQHFLPRFRSIAQMIQDPKLDPLVEFAKEKGQPLTDIETAVLSERIKYARIWIEKYAPDNMVFKLSDNAPISLSDTQIQYLQSIIPLVKTAVDADELQQVLYQTAKDQSLPPKDAFAAIYQIMIGKTHGPKAAWLLMENKSIFQEKLTNLDKPTSESGDVKIESTKTTLITLDESFIVNYPSACVGFALIKGITVRPFDQKLETERQALLEELSGLTTEQIGEFPEIQSYRRMYKQMGIDWHSRRPSPEALLRRIATGKGLYPPINTCVDAYNLIVMKSRISSGAFDAAKLSFPTLVKIAQGGEKEFFIGDKDEPTILKTGEVAYFDKIGPFNMDYNYRDAIRTAVTTDTKDIWINVDGIYDISPAQVLETLELNIDIIKKYCGGEVVEKGILKGNIC